MNYPFLHLYLESVVYVFPFFLPVVFRRVRKIAKSDC